jgi:single-strand DNA-binding protein
MATFNSVVLLGNLTRDPELRYTPQGVPVATFAVAVNRRTKEGDAEGVAFVDIEAWGRLAEISSAHLKRGRQILVSGELRQARWVDEASKKNRSKLTVVAGELQFLGGKGTQGKTPIPEEPAQVE